MSCRTYHHEGLALAAGALPRTIIELYENDGRLDDDEVLVIFRQSVDVRRRSRRVLVAKRVSSYVDKTGNMSKDTFTPLNDLAKAEAHDAQTLERWRPNGAKKRASAVLEHSEAHDYAALETA